MEYLWLEYILLVHPWARNTLLRRIILLARIMKEIREVQDPNVSSSTAPLSSPDLSDHSSRAALFASFDSKKSDDSGALTTNTLLARYILLAKKN